MKMGTDMTVEIDMAVVRDAERVVTSDKFIQFILSNTTEWTAAALIMQALLDKIDEIKTALGESECDE